MVEGRLKDSLPNINPACQKNACLEAFGRSVYGISPWLELKDVSGREGQIQKVYRQWFHRALANGVNPESEDFLLFGGKGERRPLVDAAFLCNAFLRAPGQLAEPMEKEVRENLVKCLNLSREIEPLNNNWVLFSAMVETGLCVLGADYDERRIEKSVRQVLDWYKGDGIYGDGPWFHWDYYNSFVIQPMLLDIMGQFPRWQEEYETVLERSRRYGGVLERLISPEGAYPVVGRSVCYRFGAFQTLSQMALFHSLPDGVSPSQVRCGLTAVIRRIMKSGIVDEAGWLVPGVCGLQPGLAERYINTGSLYLCTAVFLALGLPETDDFWSREEEPWTGKKIFCGQQVSADRAIDR